MNELESRVFDLKLIFHSDNRFVGNAAEANRLRKQIPIADQNVAKTQQMIAPLQANPKWDIRKWTEEESRRWESAIRLSASQESLFWAAAIRPLAISETFPPRHSQEFLAKSLRPKDAVMMFASHGTTMRGYLYWEFQGWTAIRQGNWRAVKTTKTTSWELYDLAKDPSESKDLSSAMPELLAKLTAQAAKAHEPVVEGTFASTDRHERDRRAKFGKQDDPL